MTANMSIAPEQTQAAAAAKYRSHKMLFLFLSIESFQTPAGGQRPRLLSRKLSHWPDRFSSLRTSALAVAAAGDLGSQVAVARTYHPSPRKMGTVDDVANAVLYPAKRTGD